MWSISILKISVDQRGIRPSWQSQRRRVATSPHSFFLSQSGRSRRVRRGTARIPEVCGPTLTAAAWTTLISVSKMMSSIIQMN